jgi:arylsulfatase A-like enzyme
MIEAMDAQIGRVLEALDANDLTENTIVIFTSDNGGERFADTWPFTGKKTDLLEGGLRIPMLIAWPARIAPGRTSDQVAISMDWLPTLLAAAGTALDPGYPPDGMNLLPVLTGNDRSGRSKTVLALQGEVAARRTRRRLQVPQNPRQHLLVQRCRGSARARQS